MKMQDAGCKYRMQVKQESSTGYHLLVSAIQNGETSCEHPILRNFM
ncbi:MAG: hypothetical protein WAV32_09385 [Halobacteriota archaeon]